MKLRPLPGTHTHSFPPTRITTTTTTTSIPSHTRTHGTHPPALPQIYLAMYPLRESEVRWDGPDCVKNLYLDTVTQCPEGDDKKKKEGGGKEGKKGGGGSGKGGGDEERR